jgi:hypothetical protein
MCGMYNAPSESVTDFVNIPGRSW